MKNIKNWILTVMGIILFIFGGLIFWFNKGNWWAASIFILLSTFLIRSRYNIIQKLIFGIFKVKRNLK